VTKVLPVTRVPLVKRASPEMKVLMVHMGMRSADMNDAVIEMAQENPNMVLIGSATSNRAILKAIQALGAGRVCFGTDAPFEMMHVVLAAYNALLDGAVSAAEKASVMGGNIARLFRL